MMMGVYLTRGHTHHVKEREPVMTKMMKTAKDTFSRLLREDEAATAVEYAIIAALVGVALIASLTTFREAIQSMLTDAAESITSN